MQINWFEIVAQIINFFILLFILQKLLYKPVINVMEERQKRIQKSQIEADEKMGKAEGLIDEYEEKIADIEQEKREILDDARKAAQAKKQSLLKDYREEAENKRRAYLKEIEDEKESFIKSLRKNLGESSVKIASRILDTISSRELEDEVFITFVENLKSLKENIPDASVLKDEKHLNLYSSKELSKEKKQIIENTLKSQLGNLKEINYELDDELILGYELSLETYTIHTNIKNYLEIIEKDIIENLETN